MQDFPLARSHCLTWGLVSDKTSLNWKFNWGFLNSQYKVHAKKHSKAKTCINLWIETKNKYEGETLLSEVLFCYLLLFQQRGRSFAGNVCASHGQNMVVSSGTVHKVGHWNSATVQKDRCINAWTHYLHLLKLEFFVCRMLRMLTLCGTKGSMAMAGVGERYSVPTARW